MSRGILYLAKGEKFVKEANISVQRVKKVMPECPISIVTNREIESDYFDEIIINTDGFLKGNKPQAMQKSPYEKTIFLDTDIYITDRIDKLFYMLNEFEIALRQGRDESHVPSKSDIQNHFQSSTQA